MPASRAAPPVLLAVVLAALGAGPSAAATKRCFGAAARDSVRPCANPTLSVTPALGRDDHAKAARCRPVDEEPATICTFGVSQRRAKGHAALIGDSHALHWRTALATVARAYRWRAYSVTAPGCQFATTNNVFHIGIRDACDGWHRDVLRWLRAHPEVRTVFVSQIVDTPIDVAPGRSESAIKIAGYQAVWRRLPKSVKRLVVIRDTPRTTAQTFECLRAAVAAGNVAPGPACPQPRSHAIVRDTAVAAAARLRSPRFRSVDLTEHFCDRANCFAVVGGARVYADTLGHLTQTYSRSLGPYLLRKVRRLLRAR